MISKRLLLAALVAGCAGWAAAPAAAQSYPTKPIRLIVPFPPGGPIDTLGRLAAQQLTDDLGQQVVVENRPGGGATIGSRAVATAEPDGYTLLFGSSGSLAIAPTLIENAGFDPVKSFAPVAMVSSGTLLLVVNDKVPAKNVKDLVAYAKAHPGKLNYGAGNSTPPHIAWGLFTLSTGTKVVFIPYKGAAPAIADLLAGQSQFIIDAPGSLMPFVEAGKLRPLAVTGDKRLADLPDVPTMAESGFPDFLMTFWTGIVAPAGTPEPIVARLNTAINKALESKAMQSAMAKFRVEAAPKSPQEFGDYIASEAKKWSGVIHDAGILAKKP